MSLFGGGLGRTLRSARLAGSVATGWASRRVRGGASHEGETLAHALRALSELRGPAMKLGQLVAMHAPARPGQNLDALRTAQRSAPPLGWEHVRRIVARELGGEPADVFAHFERAPVAAASIGQVHRATLRSGERVAVKVQHPDARAWFEADLGAVRAAADSLSRLLCAAGAEMDVREAAAELTEQLETELDYRLEARNARVLGAALREHPDLVVPRVFGAHSTGAVITYEWLDGDDLDVALTARDPRTRERAARLLLRSLFAQLLGGGVLHADPHPGNFLWTRDARLALLDFGCVKTFDDAFLSAFHAMARGRLQGDDAAEARAMQRLGLVRDVFATEERDDAQLLADWFARALLGDDVDYASLDAIADTRALAAHFVTKGKLPPRQRDFLLLTRVVLGLLEYLARAGVTLSPRDEAAPFLARAWQRDGEVSQHLRAA